MGSATNAAEVYALLASRGWTTRQYADQLHDLWCLARLEQ